MPAPEPISLSALLQARDSGQTAPPEMVAQASEAIRTKDDDIVAFTHVENRPAISNGAPLSGIAIGIKDILDTADMPTGYGSEVFAGHRPRTDAAVVALARRRGATIIGKTVTTEYAFFEPGPTVNPHNTSHTPGGSSSGSAAAVAAGMVPATIGTQTGGSVLRPAAYCGIAGYKPSFRLLPATGMKHFAPSLDTVGLFAATVTDVALFADLLTGRDLRVASDPSLRPADIRIGLYRCSELPTADAAMQAALETAIAAAQAAGFTIIPVEEPDVLKKARAAHSPLQAFEAGMSCGPDLALFEDQLSQRLKDVIREGQAMAPQAYDTARRDAKRGRMATAALFDDIDILLTPSAPGPAPRGLASTGDPRFNKLWTLMGTPSISIPAFSTADGLPLGIQAVARFGDDRRLLKVAAHLEKVFRTAA
ncbi:amidase [Pseudohoeflea coraliihabitans]|uniref:Amidase n=1 Tax=Pseudohoeflea coraliihabitans TaxID=2860393 RepID=A0ABS6WJ29_9HYPH|nr:amidase [Pseudohoeflea sp. DP4N28-3]MBW3095942.1 amidase [Pseudohoeflea sp. DP4N28-3]